MKKTCHICFKDKEIAYEENVPTNVGDDTLPFRVCVDCNSKPADYVVRK